MYSASALFLDRKTVYSGNIYIQTFLHHQVLFDGFLVQWEAPIQAFEWLSPVETPDMKASNGINIVLYHMCTDLVWYLYLSSIYETTEFKNVHFVKETYTLNVTSKFLKESKANFT